MSTFDIVVYGALIVAAITGFNAGLLRSAVTILGYLIAMPIAVWATSLIAPQAAAKLSSPPMQNSMLFFGIFVVAGIALGKVLRMAIDDAVGMEIGIADRLGGAALGAVRVGLVAITFVLIFDRLVPASRQPAYLAASHLRPMLSQAGAKGFKSLPPDVAVYIDQLKKDRHI
jgi:membrane protein required for colicin V production